MTERLAREVLAALAARMEQVRLRLHPAKTKIVCVPRAQKERLGCR